MDNKNLPIIVIGAGSVGMKFVNGLLFRQPGALIKIFANGDDLLHSRRKLSQLLAGDIDKESFDSTNKIHTSKDIKAYPASPIIEVDPKKKEVTDRDGNKHQYKKLVFATDSFPLVHNIKGIELDNVFPLFSISDVEHLIKRQKISKHTVVIGGGLVGLDAACAMNKNKVKTTVVESHICLMNQLLDERASVYLRLFLDSLGIDVHNQTRIISLEGKNSVEHVVLDDGTTLDCDTVIYAAGILPNTDLAESIDLKINRGIIVNDHLQTSDKDIYAIGECAEHNGHVSGVTQSGFEQAAVLAKVIAGGKAKYTGSLTSNQLSVVEYPILSIGDISIEGDDVKEILYRDIKKMRYRKLVLKKGYLQGVIATGPWEMSNKIYDLVERKRRLWPWQRKKFTETGIF